MYKIYTNRKGMPWGYVHKLLLIMRLTTVFLIATIMQVSAGTYAQKITIHKKNAPLSQVINDIREQSGYDFFYSNKLLSNAKPVSIDVKDASLTEVLEICFRNQPLSYKVENKGVMLKEKIPSLIDRVAVLLTAMDIRGVIRDTQGNPMAGASVILKGKNQMVRTNEKGEFFIKNAGPNDMLIVTFIGFITQELAVKAGAAMEIVLKEQVASLGEVSVSTGYQDIKSAKMTGAVVTVGSEELEKRNVTNLLSNLEGKVPGLVHYNGATTIRGLGTMISSQSVLVVVDGFPIEGSVADINPYDVESINVLKDAAAAAIYGARASNGVIVVTTKKAKIKGKTTVDFSTNYSYFQKPDYTNNNYMTPAEQVDVESKFADYFFRTNTLASFEANIESGLSVTPVQYAYYQFKKGLITNAQMQSQLDALKGNDFAKEYKENALSNRQIQQYNFAVRNRGEKSQYSMVLNYKGDNSGIINAYDRQLNIFLKGSYNLAKWIDVEYGLNTVIGKVRSHNNTNATNPFNVPAYYSLFDANGARSRYSLSEFNIYSSYNAAFESTANMYSVKFNHLDELERDYNNTSSRNSRYYVSLNIKPLKGLSLKPQFQYEDNSTETLGYSEKESYTMRLLQNIFSRRITTGTGGFTNLLPVGGKLETSRINSPSYTARFQGNYDREFGRHAISIIGGTEFRQTRAERKASALFGYVDQLQSQSSTALVYETLRTLASTFWSGSISPSVYYGSEINKFGTSDVIHRWASGYANMTYTFNGKYNAFGSFRKDYVDIYGGADKFRGRPLWSAGLSWIVSDEEFIKNIKAINYLKLRTSYGVTGNVSLDYTARQTATISGTNTFTREPIANIVIPPNGLLRWEKTATSNIGLDFALFDQRLRGNLDVYRKKGTDLFARKRLDATLGFASLVINNGDMLNNGVELGLNYDWFKAGKNSQLGWTSSLVISKNKNKITSVDEIVTNPAVLAGSGTFTVGNPVNSLYSYQFRGLSATGLPQWLLSDGTITTASVPSTDLKAVVFSGNMDPSLSMAFNNEVTYKGLSLSIYTVYYGGHYLRDNAPRLYAKPEYGALSNTILNSWTPTNTNTNVPGFGEYYLAAANANPMVYADEWVKSADFFKIRNFILGYQLPATVARKIGTSKIRLRLQVDNPNITWSKDKLTIDPETRGLRLPTSYILGVNVNF